MYSTGWFVLLPIHLLATYDVPWVPTRYELIKHIMRIARVGPGDIFYDLGCGDGRIVIEAAKRGAKAVCIEIREDLLQQAKENARKACVYQRIRFIHGDFFKIDLSDATIVYMYLLTRVNEKLRPKLQQELSVGTRIVTLDFAIPKWRPVHIEKHYTGGLERIIYLYIRGVSDVVMEASPN